MAERKAMIDREHDLPITKQAEILKVSRGSVYYLPRPVSSVDLAIMQRLDRLHLEFPFAGSRMLRVPAGVVSPAAANPPRAVSSNQPHPNDLDASQCVQPLFNKSIEMGPAVMQCANFARFESARIVDRKVNGSNTDVIAEITLRAVQGIGAQSMAASMCTGLTWKNDLQAGERIVLKKVLTFQVFPSQAICLTQGLNPLVGGNSYKN
jgi:hypothetical protein